jgi:hypothetical protein
VASRERAAARASRGLTPVSGMSITIGVHLNGDEVDFVYEEGALLVRDAYVDQVRAVAGDGEVMDGRSRVNGRH